MKVTAIGKDIGIPPRKVRLVVDMVRGKQVDQALSVLRFLPTPAANAVAKVVKSAAANAENNYEMDINNLKIVDIIANEGHKFKRYRPQGRGRVSPILKRSTHIIVSVAEEVE